MEALLSILVLVSLGSFFAFNRVGGRERGRARGLLVELAARRGIEPYVERLVDAVGLDVEERGLTVTVAQSTRDPFCEFRVAIPPPGMPPFTITCAGTAEQALECEDPGLRAVIDAWVRDHRDALADVTIRAFPTVLVMRCPATYGIDALEAGIRCAVDVALLDVLGTGLLKRLPGATYHGGDEPYVLLDGPGDIRAGLRRTDTGFVTYMRTSFGADPPGADKVGALGAALELGQRHITLVWPHVQHDPQVIDAAIELLRSLPRAPSLGVFR